MSSLAPLLQAFFTDRLMRQRRASAHTVAAYRDAFRLLLHFVHERTGTTPSSLDLSDLDAATVGAFLEHLEHERANTVRTRNARLAAIHSFFRYASFFDPANAASIQRVLAIPNKRFDRAVVSFLTRPEIEALLAAPDRRTWFGRRDHALLTLDVRTGLRVSELAGLAIEDMVLGSGAHVRCHGKGRKERCTPLLKNTADVMAVWFKERGGGPQDPVFPSRRGARMSADAIESLVAKHAAAAAELCPSLADKQVAPHVLRHTCAVELLRAGVDLSVIALWLGHESIETTQIYLHADLSAKERAIARTAPPNTPPGRYKPPDSLLAFLESL